MKPEKNSDLVNNLVKDGRVGIWAPTHWGLGETDVLLVPLGQTSKPLTDHLIHMVCLGGYIYSPFCSSLPFEHLSQSNLFT